jgi:acyl-CoA thioesterase-1
MPRGVGLLAPLALVALAVASLPACAESRCAVPHELIEDDGQLPATAATVTRHQPVTVVTIGGASTAGMGASGAAASYPMRLQVHLSAQLPGHTVTVLNKAVARQTAAEMAGRLAKDVLAERPSLVVWETGTVDAVRGVELDAFSRTLTDGIARIKADGADVILIDPQYSPRMLALMNLQPYLEAVHMIGDAANIDVFNRFDIMHHWIDEGRFDMTLKPPKLTAEIDAIYDCIGQLLAQLITERLVSEGVKNLH